MNLTRAALVEARKAGITVELTIDPDAASVVVRASKGQTRHFGWIALAKLDDGDDDALVADVVRQAAAQCG